MKNKLILYITLLICAFAISGCGGGGADDNISNVVSGSQNTVVENPQSLNKIDLLLPSLQTFNNFDQQALPDSESVPIHSETLALLTTESSGKVELINTNLAPGPFGSHGQTCIVNMKFLFTQGVPVQLANDITRFHGDLAKFVEPPDLPQATRLLHLTTPGTISFDATARTVSTDHLVDGVCSEFHRALASPKNNVGIVSTPIALGIGSIVGIATRVVMVGTVGFFAPQLAPVASKVSACFGGAVAGMTVLALTGDLGALNVSSAGISGCALGFGGASSAAAVASAFRVAEIIPTAEIELIGLANWAPTLDLIELTVFARL